MKKYLLTLFILAILVCGASAIPTTDAVTDISSDSVTFHASGGAGIGWFKWGSVSGNNYYWATPNQSVSGSYSDYQQGPPMISGHTYYVVACDSTGCGAEVSFSVPIATPVTQTAYGSGVIRLMRSGFNITQSLPIVLQPYTSQQALAPYMWAFLFFAIFSGWWLRQGDITIPMIVSLTFGFTIWGAGVVGTGFGVPPEAMNLGIGLVLASVAGLMFSIFSK